ncbi:hypothetical protein PFNF135_01835 [Plasmodium falciparum NF135/5.C10]|nr:hypothetical protein PFNF135_01835 [Plasmodium falciparum NF135/5.C10]
MNKDKNLLLNNKFENINEAYQILGNKIISIEDIFYYIGDIMKEMMEGQNIREEKVAELLKDRLDLYIDNEDE